MTEYAIGVDLGGTNLRAAAIDRSGTMLDKISGATNFAEGRNAVLGDIAGAIAKLRDKHGSAGLAGIGVGVPGFIRIKEGFSPTPTIFRISRTFRCATSSPFGWAHE